MLTVRSNQQSQQGSAKLRAQKKMLTVRSNQQSFTGSAKPHAQKKMLTVRSNQQSQQGSAKLRAQKRMLMCALTSSPYRFCDAPLVYCIIANYHIIVNQNNSPASPLSFKENRALPAKELIQQVIAQTQAYSGFQTYLDDFTLVIVKKV